MLTTDMCDLADPVLGAGPSCLGGVAAPARPPLRPGWPANNDLVA